METLTIAPVQWSELNDIDIVEPINDGDTDCLAEIRDVLKRHGKLTRFGVALLHKHFDLAIDEVMLETTHEESRTLVIKPTKESEAGPKMGTVWMLREGEISATSWCQTYCRRTGPYGQWSHREAHRKVRD